jgi:hypothetical protein
MKSAATSPPSVPCPFSEERLAKITGAFPPPLRGERLITGADAVRVNYFPDEWMAMVADAQQKNYRKYSARRAIPTANLVNDYFERADLDGARVLELGPGHYTFALVARALGASVVCVERDPTLLRFGAHLGFETMDANFLEPGFPDRVRSEVGAPFDGLWLRGVCNACNFPDEAAVAAHVRGLTGLLTEKGWGWATTCNVDKSADDSFVDARIECQREAFEQEGWTAQLVSDEIRERYRLNFKGCRYIFSRRLGGG